MIALPLTNILQIVIAGIIHLVLKMKKGINGFGMKFLTL